MTSDNDQRQLVPFEPGSMPDLELGYYRCHTTTDNFQIDDLVYLLEVTGDDAMVVRGETKWRFELTSFASRFAFDPDGHAHRAAEMASLMGEIAQMQRSGVTSGAALRQFNPHINNAGAVDGMQLPAVGRNPLEAKRSLAEVRNAAALMRADMESRQLALKAFAEEQAMILRQQTAELTTMLNKAEEAVWTINLYLGTEEEIVQLAEGPSAPADTPITVRQLVLYMDEECAVAAESGGIDARAIEQFDEWLTSDPAHLAQVFPEPKGMVALKPRRKTKEYGDPWVNKALNEANRKTYFLLRNGDNLYRMWTDIEVSDHLLPRTDEFLSHFVERRYDHKTNRYETVQLKPGSASFMKAEAAAEATKRHYMRVALVLQGLIDRTTVFAPMATKINVADQASYEGPLQVILDADMMLSDGKERFADWFKRINNELEVGMRVIGVFNSWEHGLRHYDRESRRGNERISPAGAGYPRQDQLYTLESKRDGGFVIYFDRDGERWDNYEGFVGYQKRASCVIYPHDKFLMNFDAATVEEMTYYLNSRLDRADYTYLFPILKTAIALKHQEADIEAPFVQLLASQIVTEHGVGVEDAMAAVPELVNWWKFKNRTHRALTDDDSKALRMIVAEFGLRVTQEAERAKRADKTQVVVDMILSAEPDALAVAHKANSQYVALIPANEENIFVHEQTWTTRGLKETKSWRTVDARHQRWQMLYKSVRWADWKIGASRLEHLSDPEREELIVAGWHALTEDRAARYRPLEPATPLAASVRDNGKLELYYIDAVPVLPKDLLLSNRIKAPDLGQATIRWRRRADRTVEVARLDTSNITYDAGMPWESDWQRRPYAGRVLWADADAVKRFRSAAAAAKLLQRRAHTIREASGAAFASVESAYLAQVEDEARAKFAADFGDPALWEGHRKTLKLPTHLDARDLREALDLLAERDIDPSGLTVAEVIRQGNKLQDKSADEFGRAPKALTVSDEVLQLVVLPTNSASSTADIG